MSASLKLERAELVRALGQLAPGLLKRRERLQQAIRRAAHAIEFAADPTEVAFDLATSYRELRLLGGLLQVEPEQRRELLSIEGKLDPKDAQKVLVLVDELELSPKLVDALSWALSPWFARPEPHAEARLEPRKVQVVLIYSPEDDRDAMTLELHLRALQEHEGAVDLWSEARLRPGEVRETTLRERMQRADLILVLASAALLADGWRMAFVEKALTSGKRCLVILLRPLPPDYLGAFLNFQYLPRSGRPIGSWRDPDAAWTEVASGIRKVVDEQQQQPAATPPAPVRSAEAVRSAAPRTLFSWLHLADLQFGPRKQEPHEWDQTLVFRAMQRDVIEQLRQPGRAPLDAVFLTGNVAAFGRTYDFAEAAPFLDELSKRLSLSPEQVFVVPGNHDVDRSNDSNRQLRRLLRVLRDGEEALDEALADPQDRALLLERQSSFRDFASRFAPFCLHKDSFEGPSWRHIIHTTGGLRLRILGLNTVLLSASPEDRGQLRIGKQPALDLLEPALAPGELAIALSYHPLQGGWLADEVECAAWMQHYVHLHLSGPMHEEERATLRQEEPRGFVKLAAGALYNSAYQREGYTYNLAGVVASSDGELRLRLWPRFWSSKTKSFHPNMDVLTNEDSYIDVPLPVRLS